MGTAWKFGSVSNIPTSLPSHLSIALSAQLNTADTAWGGQRGGELHYAAALACCCPTLRAATLLCMPKDVGQVCPVCNYAGGGLLGCCHTLGFIPAVAGCEV